VNTDQQNARLELLKVLPAVTRHTRSETMKLFLSAVKDYLEDEDNQEKHKRSGAKSPRPNFLRVVPPPRNAQEAAEEMADLRAVADRATEK
jgi:hypothetical protein